MTAERKRLEAEVKSSIMKIIRRMEQIRISVPGEPYVYVDMQGLEYRELPGEYHGTVTEAVAHDMSLFAELLGESRPDVAEIVTGWAEEMLKLNGILMGMGRSMALGESPATWDGRRTVRLLVSMARVVDMCVSDGMADLVHRCRDWSARLMYMDDQAFCIEVYAVDCDSCMYSDNERAFLKCLVDVRRSLADLLLQVSVTDDAHREVREAVTLLGNLADGMIS